MYLVNLSQKISHNEPTAKFEMRFFDTDRLYPNDITMVAILGAMLNTGYTDFTCTGFSHQDGSPQPSSDHNNWDVS